MEFTREEILPGIWLTALRTDKFKTGVFSISLLSQLERKYAAKNALYPGVLRRGCATYRSMDAISGRLDSLYGAVVSPTVRRMGEIQASGFISSFANDGCIPGGGSLCAGTIGTTMEILLSPYTRGGLLLPDYVNSERCKLIDRIRARKNDKSAYAVMRLTELMCRREKYSVFPLGDEDRASRIKYRSLTMHYRSRLNCSPVEIFYCGGTDINRIRAIISGAFELVPRGEIESGLGTAVRIRPAGAEPREFTEEMDVGQGKLAIGWRLGGCMKEHCTAAIRIFNGVFGGSVNSKLFSNVREKLSLCYYASSSIDLHKGLLIASSGVDPANFDRARDEIFAQIEAMRKGEISAEELESAKLGISGDLRSVPDDPAALEWYWLNRSIDGEYLTPGELASMCESVTRDDVVRVAESVACDAVYYLKGTDSEVSDGIED